MGIPASLMPGLFDRVGRGEGTTVDARGINGLGLALTREIVRRMGGDIHASSQPGRGSVFVATLACTLPGPATLAPLPQATPAAPLLTGLHVLAAEDHGGSQALILAMLQRLGHRAEIVANGSEAVRRAQDDVHDVLLLDMEMPGVDGPQAARWIRALPGVGQRLPIVAMTAHARAQDRLACLQAGMDDYLAKPIELQALADAIARAVARRRQALAGEAAPAVGH